MATTTTTTASEFWDFVACAVCHLAFAPQEVPFWITECGHVLCNAHLNPDQSCSKCAEQNIQLVPLQRNIDPPMSDWFRDLPTAIDGMANAVKFQQESLSALVRHYRTQCMQLAATCDRLRLERRSLRRDAETLRRELHLSRSRGPMTDQPSAHLNHNGKRPMQSSVKTNSSPRSVPTPVGPLRLTIPPGEHPTFARQEHPFAHSVDRPGSSRFAEQYAYRGGDTTQTRPTDEQQSASPRQPRSLDTMPPPPPPTQGKRFKPMTGQVLRTDQRMEPPPQRISEYMRPPPTPQRPFSVAQRMPTQNAALQAPSALPTNRFVPRGAGGSVSTAPGGNRMPFMPRGANGFG